ncbi:hypothetical protein EYF80_038040 [Liparis tanakae]|uniref:Uncharacterized protein n=1 Tax=Liparis tanakae TaxID=230148 RepID=A0A4Z2GEF2_9TELE|nr:hypothetical protein EYF80_038040 [Liparis tanakae]
MAADRTPGLTLQAEERLESSVPVTFLQPMKPWSPRSTMIGRLISFMRNSSDSPGDGGEGTACKKRQSERYILPKPSRPGNNRTAEPRLNPQSRCEGNPLVID